MPDLVLGSAATPLDLALLAWLDAKSTRSGSKKTETAYTATMASFRAMLQQAGTDLDGDLTAISLLAQAWAGQGSPSPATFNQRLAIISSFYSFAMKRGFLAGNPIARVERRRVEAYAGARALPNTELRLRMAAIDRGGIIGARDYALLAVALQTGRRLSELAGLRWAGVHLAGGTVTLHWRRTKGGKVMSDELPAGVGRALLDYLQRLYGAELGQLAPEAPIWVSFSRNGSSGQPLSIRSIANICDGRLGVSTVHSLRHTFAQGMEDVGAKVSDIQARLGHSSLATTGRYLQALKRSKNAQADALAELFGLDG